MGMKDEIPAMLKTGGGATIGERAAEVLRTDRKL
jgi:hypothetical protein